MTDAVHARIRRAKGDMLNRMQARVVGQQTPCTSAGRKSVVRYMDD